MKKFFPKLREKKCIDRLGAYYFLYKIPNTKRASGVKFLYILYFRKYIFMGLIVFAKDYPRIQVFAMFVVSFIVRKEEEEIIFYINLIL